MCFNAREIQDIRTNASINADYVDTLCLLCEGFFASGDTFKIKELNNYRIAEIFYILRQQNKITNDLLNNMDQMIVERTKNEARCLL